MGCGASTAAPPSAAAKYEPTPEVADKTAATTVAADRTIRFDVLLSHHEEADGIAARTGDKLAEYGYRICDAVGTLAETSTAAIFLSPKYLSTPKSCAELCKAVELGVNVLLVVVDGATWGGKSFPDASDVPEKLNGVLRPRDAFVAALAKVSNKHLQHTRSYFDEFVDELKAGLGPPPEGAAAAIKSTEAEEAKKLISRAATLTAMAPAAADGADDDGEEKPVSVVVDLGDGADSAADGGITLVGGATTLVEIRSNLAEEHAPEEGEEEDDPAAKVLAAGTFAFVLGAGTANSKLIKREDELNYKGRELGEPITVKAQ